MATATQTSSGTCFRAGCARAPTTRTLLEAALAERVGQTLRRRV